MTNIFSSSGDLDYPQYFPETGIDFINNRSIPPEYTFTRNSSGTYVDTDGLIKTAAANEPRFDYDPATGEFKGLLVEGQLTNIFKNHSTFSGQSCAASTSNLNWTKNSTSVSTNQTIAPDGTLSAARLTHTSNGGYLASNAAGYPTAFGVNVGTQRCLSIFAKAGSVSEVLFRQGGGSDYGYSFNIETNAPEQIFQFGYSIKYPNGWFRVVISRYLSNGGAILITTSPSTAGSSIFIWGPQGEIAERASSYISAPGNSNVTRQPDQLILNRPFNSLGTFFVEANKTTGITLSADNGTSGLVMSSTGKEALYYNTNRTLRMSSDSSPSLVTIPAPQDLNRVSLGHNALQNSQYINGYLKKFMYYGSPITEDNLRSLTGNTLDTYRSDGTIVTNGLVLYLDAGNPESYPGSGTTWTDLSGNGNNGTLEGAGYNSANGGSISFDGTDDYVRVPSTNGLYFANQSNITVSWWGKINSYNNTNTLVMWEDVVGLNGREPIRLSLSDNYYPRFGIYRSPGGNTNSNDAMGTSIVNLSTFYNIVGTFDGTNLKVYLNGILEGTQEWSGVIQAPVNGTAVRWIISAGELGDPRYMNTNTAQVSIYNKALTASEIQQNFNALRGRFGI